MKKLYLMLAFVVALALPGWHGVKAQTFSGSYDFETGVDASRWITLTAPVRVALNGDDAHSTLMPLGFTMPLGTREFTHWYATTNGYIGLGDATITPEHGSYSSPFNSLSGARLAIIDALGCDGYFDTAIGQGCWYQMFADATDTLFVIEYCNGTYSSGTRSMLYRVQFQLRKSNHGVTIVYGPRPTTAPSVTYQTGISYNGNSDYVLINTSTHTHTWMSAGSSTSNASGVWPEANRYYSIMYDPSRCQNVGNLTVSNVTTDSALLWWNHVGTLSRYRVVCGTIDTTVSDNSLQLTGLNGGTTYEAAVYTICDTSEFSTTMTNSPATVSFFTLCAAYQALPYSENFNRYTTGTTSFPDCWTKVHANGNYPYVYATTTYSLHRGTEVNYLYTYCANATVYTMAASPAFVVPTNGLEVHMKVSASTVNGRAYLGYMTDVTDESTFVPVSTFTPAVAGDVKEMVMILKDSLIGDTIYPTIKLQNATSTCYYGVDDFWAREVSVQQLPFYEDFNNYTTTDYVQPAGMTMVHGYNQTYRSPYVYNTTTYAMHSGADINYLYSYCANANQYGLMASPAFVVPQAGIEVYLKARLSTVNGRVQLGYMTDLSDEGSFRPVTTFTPTVASEYKDMIMRTTDSLVGDTIYIAIRFQNTTSTCYYSFEDLEIRENMNGLENLPYTFDFNTARTGSISPWTTNPFAMYRRWTPVLQYSTYPYAYTTATYAPDGSYYLYHYTNSASPYLIAMPPVKVPNDGIYVTMQAKANNTYATLMLGYMTDPTNQNSFVSMQSITTSATTQQMYYWLDNASVVGQVVYPAYRLQYTNGTTYVGIDNIQVKAAGSCRPVATVIMNNDTSGGFTVRWTETVGGLGSTFDVAYSLSGDIASATVVEGITADSLQLRGLEAGGTYYVWVRNHCGGDVLPWVSGGTHFVRCDPYYELPIRENFDSYTSSAVRGNVPRCWDVPEYSTTTSTYPYIYANSTYAYSGSNALYCYVTTNQSFTIRTKPFLLPAEGVMGKLKVRYTTNTGAELRFGIMTDPNNIATFQPLTTYMPMTVQEKEEMYFYYGSESLVGQPIYAAFQLVYVNSYVYCYVDDVEIEVATACRPATDITYDNVTPTSMTVNWVDNSASADTYYQVAYSLNHLRDAATISHLIDSVRTTSVNLSGLYPGMRYRTWVRKMCGGTAMPWVDGPAIETPCQTYTLPMVENFDEQFVGSPTTMTPNCWTLQMGSSYSIANNSTYAHSGSYSMYLPLAGTGIEARIVSPAFHMPTSGFLYGNIHAYISSTQARINLGVMSDINDASTYRVLKTYTPTTGAVDNDIYFYLDSIPAAGEELHVVISATSLNGAVDVYLDDIELREGTSCHRVFGTAYSNVRPGSMHITWNDETHADSTIYQVAYSTTNNVASATIVDNIHGLSHDLTGLTMDATYYVWVRNICGTDTLYWDQIGPIRVPYTPATLPYEETFESYASGTTNFPTHWWKLTANGNYPYVYSTAGYNTTASGSKVLYSYISTNDMTTMVATRGILLPDTGVVVTMNAAFSGVNHIVDLGYLTDINDPSTFVVKSSVTSSVVNNTAAAEKDQLFFYFDDPNLYDSIVYLAIRHRRVAGAGSYYLGIDDIKVAVAPSCRYASNVTYSNVEAGTVTVRWEDNSVSPGTYEIIYGTAATRSSATDTIHNLTLTNYYTFYGLDTNQDYYFWVRSICTEPSPWAAGGKVHVPCVESPLPYFNDFTGLTTGTAYFTNCWTKVVANGSYPYLNSSYYTGTSPAIYSYHTSSAPVMYATVPVRMPGTGLYFQCDINQSNINGQVVLGVMTNLGDPTTFIPLKYHYADAASQGKEAFFYYDNDDLTNQIVYGVVKSEGATSFYFGVDNVYMSEAGTCRRLSDIRICESTVNSATVCWSDNSPSMSYEVAYSTTNSLTDVANMHIVSNVFDTTCVLNDLSIGTTYYIWVRNACLDTLMPWSPATVFTTPCGDIEGRYEQSFDSYAASVFPNCWTKVYEQPSTPPVTIASNASSGTMSLRLTATADTALVASPRVALPANQIHVMFNSYPSTTSSILEVGYMTNVEDATTFVPLYVARDLNSSQETQHEFYTDDVLTSDTVYIAFRLTSVRNTLTSYVFLDDILIEPSTDCRRPVRAYVTDITHEGAVLNFDPYSWTDNSFEIRYGTVNNPAFATTNLPVSSSPVMLTGLTPNTTYYAFVRTRCFYDSTSWKSFPAFTTLPTCSEVTSITPDVAFRGVNLTWEVTEGGLPIYGYEVTYTYGSTSTTVTDTVFDRAYAIVNTDTNELISYQVKVLCGASEVDITEGGSLNGEVTTRSECDHPTEMSAAATTVYLPSFTYDATYGGYSYTQQVFYNSELATLGDTLTSISFRRSGSTAITRRWQIFLGNTDQDNLEEWVPFDSLRAVTPVREYTLNQADWVTFTFDTVFVRRPGANLVVAVLDSTGTVVGIPFYAATHTNSSRRCQMAHGVAICPDPHNPDGAEGVRYYSQYVNDVRFESRPACVIPECGAPLLAVNSTTDSTISISWTPVSSTPATYFLSMMNENGVYVPVDTVYNNNYTFRGLVRATTYNFRVERDCGVRVSGQITAKTDCVLAPVPFTEDFETASLGAPFNSNCWLIESLNPTGYDESLAQATRHPVFPYCFILTGQPEDQLLKLMGGSWVATPKVDAPLNQLELFFTQYVSDTNFYFYLGYLTDDNTSYDSVVWFDTVVRSEYFHIQEALIGNYTVDLWSLPDNASRIVFASAQQQASTSNNYFGEITLRYPAACAAVTNVTASNITSNSATITWDHHVTGSGYIVEYGMRMFVRGTGTIIRIPDDGPRSVTINGLDGSTLYDVYVSAICPQNDPTRSDRDTSDVSPACGFQTLCGSINTMPYTYSFNEYRMAGTTYTHRLPACWAFDSVYTHAVNRDSMPNMVTVSAMTGDMALLMSNPTVLGTAPFGMRLDTLMITFTEYAPDPNAPLIIGAVDSLDQGFAYSFVGIDTMTYTPGVTFYNRTVYLADYNGNAPHIAFKTLPSIGSQLSMHRIDDLVINYAPPCLPVRDLRAMASTDTSITLTWRDYRNPTAWIIEYGPAGFTLGTGTTINASSRPFTINRLQSNTTYDFYVRPACSATPQAEWSPALRATTECSVYGLPYAENFNRVEAAPYDMRGNAPDCWKVYSDGSSQAFLPHVVDTLPMWNSPDASGALVMTSGIDPYGNTSIAVLPMFARRLSDLYVTFWYSTNDVLNGTFTVGYVTGNDFASTFIPVRTMVNNATGTTDTVKFNMLGENTTGRIALRWLNSTGYNSVSIDNLVVDTIIPPCPHVDNVNVNTTYRSATVTWIGDSTEVIFHRGTTFRSDEPSITVTNGRFFVDTLTMSTDYVIGLRTLCYNGTRSGWDVFNVRTDTLICHSPNAVSVDTVSYRTATISWTNDTTSNRWEISAYSTVDTLSFIATSSPFEITGLTQGRTYSVIIRSLCGTEFEIEGAWAEDTVTFTTRDCLPATGLTVGTVTAITAEISWTAPSTASGTYIVNYGLEGFPQGYGNFDTVYDTHHTITGLEANTAYDVYVASVCEGSINSVWTSAANFITDEARTFHITVRSDNERWGTVTGSGDYEEGTTVQISATAVRGYHFVEWDDHDSNATRSIYVTGDATYTAFFAEGEGIDEVNADNDIMLYPNPASTTVTVLLKGVDRNAKVSIVDMNGRQINQWSVENGESVTVDVSNLSQGAYFVRVVGDRVNAIRKLIVR